MLKAIEKICLGAIYLGIGIILFNPLFVDNSFFFPFISTKVFAFRILVEILLLIYLLLNVVSKDYRPRFGWVFALAASFVVIATISSVRGGNFSLSFWGDMERGEGLMLWLHLLIYLLILLSVVRSKMAWTVLLDVVLTVGLLTALFGLGQALQVSALLATSGTRVDATFGNPAFFGTYLLFQIAFACYLFLYRKTPFLKIYYALLAVLFALLIPATQTRGALVGLGGGIVLAAILFAWLKRDKTWIRRGSFAIIFVILLSTGGLYLLRQKPFVHDSPILSRIVSISFKERTAQTRLATWRAAWSGWKEKFFLGWGLENFDTVFNKDFPPIIYEDEGSQVWFDRAHNIIFDRGVTTGIVGLVIFLALFLYPFYYLMRRCLRDPEQSSTAIIFSSFLLAYLIQDLFIFESVGIYIVLFFTLAFFSTVFLREDWLDLKFLDSKHFWIGLLIVYGFLLGPLVWKINIYPAKINAAAADALRSDPEKEDFFVIVDRYKKVIEAPTYGRQEYRLNFIEFVDQRLANVGEVVPEVKPVVAYTDEQAKKQIAEASDNAKNHLLVMRHYNYTFAIDPATKIDRLEKAMSFYPRLVELSPTRPQVYQEAGYSHLYLYRIYKEKQDREQTKKELQLAEQYFLKTINLQPRAVESYVNLLMLYLNSGDDEKTRQVIKTMDERKIGFRSHATLARLINLARSSGRVEWIGYFSEEQTKLRPDDPEAWISLAIFYATSGNRIKAIEIANRIKEFGDQYVEEANAFIQNVNKGQFEKKK